jgi:hypothetical protein
MKSLWLVVGLVVLGMILLPDGAGRGVAEKPQASFCIPSWHDIQNPAVLVPQDFNSVSVFLPTSSFVEGFQICSEALSVGLSCLKPVDNHQQKTTDHLVEHRVDALYLFNPSFRV